MVVDVIDEIAKLRTASIVFTRVLSAVIEAFSGFNTFSVN